MILHNEFTVAAEFDAVWSQLLDMERVAACLPGATITATEHENVYDGTMRLKIGPMTVEYRGRAELRDIDEQAHTAVIALSAREAKGQGTALATVINRLERADGGTRVVAETDLNITGPQAQFGRGVIEDVGGRVMAEFSRRLEQQIAASQRTDDGAADTTPAAREPADVLDVGSFVPRRMVAALAAVGGALLALLALVRRRRHR